MDIGQFDSTDIFLCHNFLILLRLVFAHFSNTIISRCVFETISLGLGYTIGYRGGWKFVTSYLKGVQRIVTKCDDGGGGLIFP